MLGVDDFAWCMDMKIGIAGPPFGGKTTLFAAMTGQAPDPAKASETAGVLARVSVPDPRLDHLSSVFRPKKHTPTQLDVLDFPGVELGDSSEHKRQILAQLREMDALVLVFGAYAEGETPAKAAETYEHVKTEFFFADLDILDKRIEKLKESAAKSTKTRDREKSELASLERIKTEAERRETLVGITLDAAEEKLLRGFAFLNMKPTIVVINEKDAPAGEPPVEVKARCPGAIRLSAKIELELAELPPADREPFLRDLGITEPAGPRLIREVYGLLGLVSFFTTGEDECRAWTIKSGDNAVTAAGKVHTDLSRGFIRAEVYHVEDFKIHGSEKALKAKGLMRMEGRDYVVRDGDVLSILFNVSSR
jgi:GTP-binding protein YchF